MKTPLRIAITSGDPDGIGMEIVSKALVRLKPQKNVHFFIWRSTDANSIDLKRIDRVFSRVTVGSWQEALSYPRKTHKQIVEIVSKLPAAKWVEISAQACMFGHIQGIATAPLSKTSIIHAGFKDIGHTEILKRVAATSNVHMSFIGSQFSVVLATGHQSTVKAIQGLNAKVLTSAINAAEELRSLLPREKRNLPIAVLGVNPHAGESGLLGDEETEVIQPVIEDFNKRKIAVEGPLVPDAAFLPKNWKKYSVFVATYHDQGLIPFKTVHKHQSGVHLSMGLPFVRTSVDHGTAKDIFGRNIADYRSMLESIEWCIKLGSSKM